MHTNLWLITQKILNKVRQVTVYQYKSYLLISNCMYTKLCIKYCTKRFNIE